MALENYRITEFQEKTQIDNGDYVLIDSATDGTHKYQLSRIPAQASAEVDAAVAAEKAQRQAADAELAGDIGTLSSGKVDKVAGKGLSKNDFTDALKTKLDGIEAGAEVNDVTSVAGKTGAVTLAGGDVSYSGETTYAAGTVGAAISDVKSDLTAEQTARESADTALGNAISAETTAREGAVTALAGEVEADYAKKDGSYADMTAGNADQLLSTVEAVDSVPYQFRTSGGTADIGDREYDEIVGGTVAWNQLAHNFVNRAETLGITIVADNTNGTIHVSGTATATNNLYFQQSISVIAGHKYLLRGAKSGSATHGLMLSGGYTGESGNGTIINVVTSNANTTMAYFFASGDAIDVTIHPQLFDLTQMFGSTIADYIYSLETATAGAGVAFFRSLFPNDYYPYDAGSLKSVEGVSAHVTTGFNQWDESKDNIGKNIGADGSLVNNNAYATSDYIPVFPNTTYYAKNVGPSANVRTSFFYDSEKNPISAFSIGGSSGIPVSGNITTPANARYIRIVRFVSETEFCFNLSWSGYRNGEYEPYVKHTYPLDASLTLRGVPKLDSSNHLYYDGDTYEADGTVTRKYGIVDLGTLTWSSQSANNIFYATISGMKVPQTTDERKEGIVSSKYLPSVTTTINNTMTDGSMLRYNGNIYIRDTSYTDAASFKTAMSGVYLVYELATPTTEEADPYHSPQIVDDFGTEEYVTTSIVPVGHNTKYPENLRAKIEGLPWDFSTLIAPTEKTNTATRNYTSGSLLIMGNVLYKVTANIANGGTITPGTNVTATTLSEVILALA